MSFPAVWLMDVSESFWRGSGGIGGVRQKASRRSLSSEWLCSGSRGCTEGWGGDLIWGSLTRGFMDTGSLEEESLWGDALEFCCSQSLSIWGSTQRTSLPVPTQDTSNQRVSLTLNHTTTVTHTHTHTGKPGTHHDRRGGWKGKCYTTERRDEKKRKTITLCVCVFHLVTIYSGRVQNSTLASFTVYCQLFFS